MRTSPQLAEKLPMRQEFTASIAIKSSNGMGFGTAYWMQGDRIAFTTEMELDKDDQIEIRMDLTGFNDSAMGEILLIETRLEDGGMLTCLGQITKMPQADFEMLNQWLDDLISGNSTSQSSRWLRSITNSRSPQASEDETLAALRRMDKRMGRESKGLASRSPAERSKDPDSTTRSKIGRQAIRAALRASVQAGTSSQTDSPPQPTLLKVVTPPSPKTEIPVPDFPVIPAPVQAAPLVEVVQTDSVPPSPFPTVPISPSVPTVGPSAGTSATENTLQVGIRAARSPEGPVLLSWANTQSLIHTWKQGFKNGKLALPPFPNAPSVGESVRFDCTLPGGETFALRGSITASDTAGVQCAIRIPWGTRIKLLRIQEKA